jgi:hypothetical protein
MWNLDCWNSPLVIIKEDPTDDPKPLKVYITKYPEYTIGNINNCDHCRMLDDLAWPNPYFAVAGNEAAVASHFVIKGLNDEILAAVDRFKHSTQ